MGKVSTKKGKVGEEIAILLLQTIGCKCIEKVPTDKILHQGKLIYTKKSSVDIIALVPRSSYHAARIEVKLCDDDKLPHSRLEPHQVKWLLEWNKYGQQSYVIWVHRNHAYMFEYPCPEYRQGMSISVERAKRISVWSM